MLASFYFIAKALIQGFRFAAHGRIRSIVIEVMIFAIIQQLSQSSRTLMKTICYVKQIEIIQHCKFDV